jgi:hypothetical protein
VSVSSHATIVRIDTPACAGLVVGRHDHQLRPDEYPVLSCEPLLGARGKLFGLPGLARDERRRQPAALPQLVVVDLGDRGAETVLQLCLGRQDVLPLALERPGLGEVELDGEDRDKAGHSLDCRGAHYACAVRLALKIAPQHSTQYADMTARLAAPELLASPAGEHVTGIEETRFGGQAYLLATFSPPTGIDELMPVLSRLGATSEVFECFDELGGLPGPFLRPIAPAYRPFVPREMAEARRYKGKTSEVFTRVLLNLAVFGGAFRDHGSDRLRVLDPLAGGGTTLFLALAAGYDAFGVELVRRNVETTATFVTEFCREQRISHATLREKVKRRHTFDLGPRSDRRLLVLTEGDARQVCDDLGDVRGGARFHAVVGDLPYGIQHSGEARRLVADAVAGWEQVLLPGAALALAWDATRLPRKAMSAAVHDHSGLVVRDDGPYAQLEHRVDRVIKRRDVLVAVKRA